MTNYEKIKNMTLDEMAEWIDKISLSTHCPCCVNGVLCKYENQRKCDEARKIWLQLEVVE